MKTAILMVLLLCQTFCFVKSQDLSIFEESLEFQSLLRERKFLQADDDEASDLSLTFDQIVTRKG